MANPGLRYAAATIVCALKADAGVTTLVSSDSIFPIIKSGANLPAISVVRSGWSCERVKASLPFISQSEISKSESVAITICIFARDIDKSNQIADAVVEALDDKRIVGSNLTIERVEVNNVTEHPNSNDLAVYNQIVTLTAFC